MAKAKVASDGAPEQDDSVEQPFSVSQRTMDYIRGEKSQDDVPPEETAPEPPAEETPAASEETAEVEPQFDGGATDGQEAAVDAPIEDVTAPAAPWFDARDAQYAHSYGMTEYDLAQFGSRDEFLKTARYLDRMAAQRQVAAPAQANAAPAEEVDGPFNKDGSVNTKWCEEQGCDEIQMAGFEQQAKLNKHLARVEQENEFLRARQIEEAQIRFTNALHDSIDKLGRTELFGVSVKNGQPVALPPAHLAKRDEIYKRVDAISEAYAAKGLPVPPLDDLVSNVAAQIYARDFAAIDAKKTAAAAAAAVQQQHARTEAVARQSTRRRPVASVAGATSRLPLPEADPNSSEAILRSPKFAQWRRERAERYGESLS